MAFECHPVRERDADGRLTASGVQWTERRVLLQCACILLSAVGFMGGALALLCFLLARDSAAAFESAIALPVIAIALAWWAGHMPGRERVLLFHRDGSTTAPLGFAHHSRRFRRVSGTHTDIVSIEARRRTDETDCDVALFMRHGGIVYVAGRLHQDHAHRVAVQLTLALTALREDLGREQQRTRGDEIAPQTSGEALLID